MLKLEKIKALAAGENHVLALDHEGKVSAWGSGEQYQFGRRLIERNRLLALTPAHCSIRKKVLSISCGANHSFAIDESGEVYAWGLNNFAQTGIENVEEGEITINKPTVVESLKPYKIQEIRGGNHHSIACTEDGEIQIWGRCDATQVGVPLDKLSRENLLFDFKNRPQFLLKPVKVPGK